MSFPHPDVRALPNEYTPYQQHLELTPEEVKILKECSREGIFQRAIPLGIVSGFGGLMAARAGPLMHAKYGVKPAVIGLGLIGYFVGRFSYSSVCIRRALEVPDGSLRKIFAARNGETVETPNAYYTPVETPKDPVRSAQSSGTDIDLTHPSNFDTVPSDYYQEITEETLNEEKAKNYTSYDDLRQQNRQEYTKKMYPGYYNQQRQEFPQDSPRVVRKPYEEPKSSLGIGQQQTKYGDAWDV